MECHRNHELRKIVNQSGLATPDGMPLVWLNHYHGYKTSTRVYGPDLMLALCEYSEARGYRHYLYGGAEGVAQKLRGVLSHRFPLLQITGTYSPPFREIGYQEEPDVIDTINAANPDIIWVGLGTPKQDFWVARHRPLLKAPVIVAVGAAFDFFTGRVSQAPALLQRCGLEWLFRLLKEPRRLAHRYLVYNPLFVIYTLMQLTGLRRFPI